MIEVGDKVLCITKVFQGFPHTVTHGKSLPLDIVLYLTPSSLATHVEYLLYFIFGFSLNKVWWWSGIVCPM